MNIELLALGAFSTRRFSFKFFKDYLVHAKGGSSRRIAALIPESSELHNLLNGGFTNLNDIDLREIIVSDVLGPHLKPGEKNVEYRTLAERLVKSAAGVQEENQFDVSMCDVALENLNTRIQDLL